MITLILILLLLITLALAAGYLRLRLLHQQTLNAVRDYIRSETALLTEAALCNPDGRCDPTPSVVNLDKLADRIGDGRD